MRAKSVLSIAAQTERLPMPKRSALADLVALLQNGDLAIICSDGLHSMINDDLIQSIMVTHEKKPLAEGCAALIAAALEAGGKDNVSVILLRYTE